MKKFKEIMAAILALVVIVAVMPATDAKAAFPKHIPLKTEPVHGVVVVLLHLA